MYSNELDGFAVRLTIPSCICIIPCHCLVPAFFVVLHQLFATLKSFGTVLQIGMYNLTYMIVGNLVGVSMTDLDFVQADD